MPLSSGDDGMGDMDFLHRGPLATTGEWTLPLGVSQARPLKLAGQALLWLSAAMLAFWAGILLAEAASGRGSWARATLACMAAAGWLGASWPLRRSLNQSGTVVLQWRGLMPSKAKAQRLAPEQHHGWVLGDQQDAVAVHVVFDLGAWLLVKMVPVQGKGFETWSWLEACAVFKGGAGHHLRALLFNRHANQPKAPDSDALSDPATMASSGYLKLSWTNLRFPSLKKFAASTVQSAVQRPRARTTLAMTVVASDFADTVLEERKLRA